MNDQVPSGAKETRVLVVEGDRGIAESLVRGLRQAEYVVDGVRTGRAALSASSPDVVLLDLGLPDAAASRPALSVGPRVSREPSRPGGAGT
ncbi:hypothetical protein [Streptomyces sp. NBC_00704]|uniref:hypothetical protein n=1 Tax=Streptomyces sp. NBC_00704 TaxID=2975809 RepID=UPI002E3207D1|nr:hypothetical protein [Streptomyces sp. NBC_00704]